MVYRKKMVEEDIISRSYWKHYRWLEVIIGDTFSMQNIDWYSVLSQPRSTKDIFIICWNKAHQIYLNKMYNFAWNINHKNCKPNMQVFIDIRLGSRDLFLIPQSQLISLTSEILLILRCYPFLIKTFRYAICSSKKYSFSWVHCDCDQSIFWSQVSVGRQVGIDESIYYSGRLWSIVRHIYLWYQVQFLATVWSYSFGENVGRRYPKRDMAFILILDMVMEICPSRWIVLRISKIDGIRTTSWYFPGILVGRNNCKEIWN